MIALRDVSSTEAAVTYTLEPVVGAGLAYVYLGERWGPSGGGGAVLIIASCLAIQLNGADTGGSGGSGGGAQPAADEDDE